MKQTISCPDKQVIEDLLANRLPSHQAAQVRSHLAECPICREPTGDTAKNASNGETRLIDRPNAHSALSPPRGPGELGWLGEYRVIGVLGEGGMAIVYDAVEPKLGRHVALKVLKAEINDPTSRERFLREARVVASLASERVVHVYAVGEDNGTPFLAMEKLVGETLAKRLERDRWLPVIDALAITREAAEGLVALHDRGMIHRDLKPDNLWLETDSHGHIIRVKLIDFGIARQIQGDPSLTNPGQVIGTPIYMAPEQASGGDIDARADLYALGCVLYRLLAGKTPFDSASPNTLAVLSAVIRSQIIPIKQVVPNLSPAVAGLIQQLLEHDKEKRPANAAALAARLRELEHEEGASTSKTKSIQLAASESHRRTPRRTKPFNIALGVVAIVAALAVGGVALSAKLWPSMFNSAHSQSSKTAPTNDQVPAVIVPDQTKDLLKVGLLFSQTDATALQEQPVLEAVQFAIEEINAAGGVLGRRIEPIVEDGASSAPAFARKASKLIDNDKVEVLFGCWSSPSRKRVAEICGDPKRDRLLFYPGNAEGLEEYENVVYLGGAPNQILVPLIKYAYADLRRRKVFVVGSESIYSRVVGVILDHEVKLLEARIVGTRNVPPGESDFKSIADEIKDSKADFIVSSLSGVENSSLFRALRSARIGPPEVPTAWLTLKETDLTHFAPTLAGDYTAGCYFDTVETPANTSFVQRYRKRFGASKRISDSMEAAYYGVYLWKHAVEKAQSSRTWDVRVALRGLVIDTADGPLKIDPLTLHAWQTGRVGKVVNEEGRLSFQVVFQTPGPIEPKPYPSWQTQGQWKEFLDKLYQEWGKNWESGR